jgi:predicted negative regulator of RcsB-dependent stress response
MSSSGRWLLSFIVAATVFCTRGAGQQPVSFSGAVRRVGGNELAHAKVRVEGAGEYETSDSGEFTFSSNNLKVGFAVVFHVRDWVITRPCELQNGRTWLHDPAEGIIPIFVLRPGDPRLKAVQSVGSIIGCLIEEEAAQFKPQSQSFGGSPASVPLDSSASYHVLDAAYYPGRSQSRADAPSQKPNEILDASRDEFLTKKAKELGFSVRELQSAIGVWTKSAENLYDKGLAALYNGRYAEARSYFKQSIASSKSDVLERYIPLARSEYELGHYPAAEDALRKVLAVHSDDPIITNNLAVVLAAQEKYSEAAPLYKRTLGITEQAAGAEDPSLVVSLSNLAALYRRQEKYSEAEAFYSRALAIDEKAGVFVASENVRFW